MRESSPHNLVPSLTPTLPTPTPPPRLAPTPSAPPPQFALLPACPHGCRSFAPPLALLFPRASTRLAPLQSAPPAPPPFPARPAGHPEISLPANFHPAHIAGPRTPQMPRENPPSEKPPASTTRPTPPAPHPAANSPHPPQSPAQSPHSAPHGYTVRRAVSHAPLRRRTLPQLSPAPAPAGTSNLESRAWTIPSPRAQNFRDLRNPDALPRPRLAAVPVRSSRASSLHRPRARRKLHSPMSQISSGLPGCHLPASQAVRPCHNLNLLASCEEPLL